MKQQQLGLKDNCLRKFGWSDKYVVPCRENNGGKLPSCITCRKANIGSIKSYISDGKYKETTRKCPKCADWALNDETSDIMSFDAPRDYPTQLPRENSPVPPPPGREVGLMKLKLMELTFPMMKQAIRFAFYQSVGPGGRGQSWTKATCQSYLRTCGVNRKQQDSVYAAARKAYDDNLVVDYEDPLRVGTYHFPAAYCGDLPLSRFIETLMHLLFLGITESLFKLFNSHYAKSSVSGRGEETFKKNIQELLKALAPLNLSWLLILPFSGSDSKRTTGTWVSENWLAFVRIMKICYYWFGTEGVKDNRRGALDLFRVVIAFSALVARLLSHAGVNSASIHLIELHIKELLSSVNEIDIRLRHKDINKSTSTSASSGKRDTDQWWLKSNFLSLLNLRATMDALGPLTNYWDGGGKGERYIQEIKPHIPRGVRDGGLFFVRLMERIYKLNSIDRIEESWRAMEADDDDIVSVLEPGSVDPPLLESAEEDDSSVNSTTETESRAVEGEGTADNMSTDTGTSSVLSDDTAKAMEWTTPMEDEQMKKARTIYIYKSRGELERSIETSGILAGIIIKCPDGSPEFRSVFKTGISSYGWVRLTFDDANGVKLCGMWYAPVVVEELQMEDPPTSEEGLKGLAKIAAVAIPLHYIVGKNHDCALKYCVITNWWRERREDGAYMLPTLDFTLYP